jgi:hypothetical protein
MSAVRFLKKSLFFSGLAILLFSISGAVLVYIYQDQLVSRFVAEANQKIDTPIQASTIVASWWEKFPNVSIVLSDVIIDGSLPGPTDTLAVAKNIYCTFNALDIIRGNWVVDQIQFENVRLFLVKTELGDNTLTTVKKDTASKKPASDFKLDKILLQDVTITYLDLLRNQKIDLNVHEISASLASSADVFDIHLDGTATSESIKINDLQYFVGKPLTISGDLRFQQSDKKWDFKEMELGLNDSWFLVNGFYQGSKSILDMTIEGQDTDIQTILSLLPQEISDKFRRYHSKGEIYFEGHLNGSVAEGEHLELEVKFGCRNASFSHPEYKSGIQKVYLSGNYQSSDASDLSKATLSLKNVQGTMEQQPFKGNLQIRNLQNYHIKGEFEGRLDLNSWQKFLPPGQVTKANGNMQVDVSFDGPVSYLNTPNSVDKFKTSGEIFVNDLSFSLADNSLPFEEFNGHFLFNGRDLAISDFRGIVGNSDFQLNGFFRNIIAFMFAKNQPIGIEADLRSHNLDLDELLTGDVSINDKTIDGDQTYTSFEINPRLALTFNCDIEQVKFRRFRGREIKGKLKISNQVANGNQIQMQTMGGQITMNGRVDGRQKNHIRVYTKSSYQGIYIDSLFHVFENFGQDFLEDQHLKGQAFAEIDTYMAFDDHLRFKSPDLVVNAGLVIENGELNNFEPLQKLSAYVDSEDLKHLKFADLQNNVQIKDREIHLPNMVVQSNVTTIAVNGTHTFDQDINYRLKVPIKSSKKDKDEYFGALEDDGLNTNLFLKITGTTQNYQVVYDKAAVKDKIKHDLKEEKWEFRNAVRNKGIEGGTQELDEEDFFEFDEADSTALQQ